MAATIKRTLFLTLLCSFALAQTYTEDSTIGTFTLEGKASSPSNPSSGFFKLYPKTSDGKLYILNSSGVESTVSAGSASDVGFTPTGSLIATDVQAALAELDADLTAHLNDLIGAHAASAISHTPSLSFVQTNLQGVLDSLSTSIQEWEVTEGGILTSTATQTVTNKDIDGGTASNLRRLTVPKQTKANADALNRKEGTIVYGTDTKALYVDNGTVLASVGSGGGSGGVNILANANPEFESGLSNWLESGGTEAAAAGANILFDTASATWDSNAAAQTYCSDLVAIPEGLKSTNGEAYIWTKVPSGTATHLLRVTDGSNTLVSTSILSTSTASKQRVNFPIPSSGSLQLCLVSVNANEPLIALDKAYLGEVTNITSVDVQDVFSANVSTTGVVSGENADWINGNCSLATNEFSCTFNTGIFSVVPNCTATPEVVTATNGGMTTIASKSSTGITIEGNRHDAVAQAYAFTLSCQKAGVDSPVKAVAANQTNYGWTSYTPTFTGFGTVTSPQCQHKRDAEDLLLRCKFTAGTPTATEARVSLPNSLVSAATDKIPSIQQVGYGAGSGNAASDFGGKTVLVDPSVAYLTFGAHTSVTASATTKQLGNQLIGTNGIFHFNARLPITGWTENNKAPTLIGSVTSDSTTAERSERARLTSVTTTSVVSQSGSWIASVTDNGTGDTTITMTSGYWSAVPSCTCTVEASTGDTCHVTDSTSPSVTVLRLLTRDTAGNPADKKFNLHCMGAR